MPLFFSLSGFPKILNKRLQQLQAFWKNVKVADEEWLVKNWPKSSLTKNLLYCIHRWRQMGLPGDIHRFRRTLLELLGTSRNPSSIAFLWESLPLIAPSQAGQLAHELGLDLNLAADLDHAAGSAESS